MDEGLLPAAVEHGLLPQGIHDASLDGIEQRFGSFQGSDRRCRLFAKLKAYAEEIRKAVAGATLIVDGSFVMGDVNSPDDIDLVLVMPDGWDFAAELRPFQYNIVSRRMVKRKYGFDVRVVRANSPEMELWIEFFSQVNVKWCVLLGIPVGTKKGLARLFL
jgi:hypothetical protein